MGGKHRERESGRRGRLTRFFESHYLLPKCCDLSRLEERIRGEGSFIKRTCKMMGERDGG